MIPSHRSISLLSVSLLSILLLCSCKESSEITVNPSEDLSPQGLSLSFPEKLEQGSIGQLTVALNYATDTNVTVHLLSNDRSALAGQEYLGIDQWITIAAGSRSALVDLFTFTKFDEVSAIKEFSVSITAAQGSEIVGGSQTIAIQPSNLGPFLGPVETFELGQAHACAALSDQRIKCWGANTFGQLGARQLEALAYAPLAVQSDTSPSQLSLGPHHTCASYASGRIVCWGWLLGFWGTTPHEILPAGNNVYRMSSGRQFLCALIDWQVKCIGDNGLNQLGVDNTVTPSSSSFVAVDGITLPVNTITSGESHTCAILRDGTALCWGDNSYGQLGNISVASSSMPVSPEGLASAGEVWTITAGRFHSCAATATGIWCWGRNEHRQLGRTTAGVFDATPQPVSGVASLLDVDEYITQVTAGDAHTCVLTSKGSLICWGDGTRYQLGNSDGVSLDPQSPPVRVAENARTARAGFGMTCFVDSSSGELKCLGDAANFKIPSQNSMIQGRPWDVDVLKGLFVKAIDFSFESGKGRACTLIEGLGLRCWGASPSDSLLGVPGAVSIYGGLTVPQIDTGNVVRFAMGLEHACALTTSGSVSCWGKNDYNQLGNATVSPISEMPRSPSGLGSEAVVDLVGGNYFSCALTQSGKIYCWGAYLQDYNSSIESRNNCLQAPRSEARDAELASGPTVFKEIFANATSACAIAADDKAYCWGRNDQAQLGNGSINNQCQRTAQPSLTGLDVEKIALGRKHGCAILKTKNVICWGDDSLGQLGNGSDSDQRVLAPLASAAFESEVVDIAAGDNHTCLLKASGAVKCWGSNANGQVGLGGPRFLSPENKIITEPRSVYGMNSGIASISARGDISCAITKRGAARCWGANYDGIITMDHNFAKTPRRIFDPN